MTYTVLSAQYANEDHTAAVVMTQEAAAVLASAADTPDLWGAMMEAVTPAPFAVDLDAHLAAHYRARRDGGVTIEGMEVKTDEGSRGLINGAVARAILRATPEVTFTFKAPTGPITITDAQVMGIGMALANHVQACIDAEAQVDAALGDYTTTAEVEAAFDAAYTTAFAAAMGGAP